MPKDPKLMKALHKKAVKNAKRSPLAPTVTEWQGAFEDAIKQSMVVGMTTAELREETGLSDRRVRMRLRVLIKEGRVVLKRRMIATITGVMMPCPVYILVKKKGTPKR